MLIGFPENFEKIESWKKKKKKKKFALHGNELKLLNIFEKKINTKKKYLRNYKINHNIDIKVFLKLIYSSMCVW